MSQSSLLQELGVILDRLERVRHQADVQIALDNLHSAVAHAKQADQGNQGKPDVKQAPASRHAEGQNQAKPDSDVTPSQAAAEIVVEYVDSVFVELLLLFVIFPSLILLASVVLAGFIALMEEWSWLTGFEYIISVTCGLATPLGNANNASPTSVVGMTAAGVSGMWTIGITGMMAGWASTTAVVAHVTAGISSLVGAGRTDHPFRKIVAIWLAVFVFSPLMLGVFVLIFGCILAGVESWEWHDGGFYILANVAGLPNPLVNDTPTNGFGIFLDVVLSTWCFMFGSIIVGLGSNLQIPTLAAFRRRARCQARQIGEWWQSVRRVVPSDSAITVVKVGK